MRSAAGENTETAIIHFILYVQRLKAVICVWINFLSRPRFMLKQLIQIFHSQAFKFYFCYSFSQQSALSQTWHSTTGAASIQNTNKITCCTLTLTCLTMAKAHSQALTQVSLVLMSLKGRVRQKSQMYIFTCSAVHPSRLFWCEFPSFADIGYRNVCLGTRWHVVMVDSMYSVAFCISTVKCYMCRPVQVMHLWLGYYATSISSAVLTWYIHQP